MTRERFPVRINRSPSMLGGAPDVPGGVCYPRGEGGVNREADRGVPGSGVLLSFCIEMVDPQIQDVATTVLRNTELGGGNFLVEFAADGIADRMAPGQFLMLGIPGSEILLRRPFSVCGLPGTFPETADGTLQVLYKVVGRGTRLLSGLGPGARLTILGPLGNGFDLSGATEARPVLVAGGIGSAPFPALLDALRRSGAARPILFYGGRSSADLPLLDWFRERCEVVVSTDDGSLGVHGLVTAPLTPWLEDRGEDAVELYACGPDPMLRAVRIIAGELRLPCQLSLEAHMACGFGVCIGCVVPTHGGCGESRYERVCVEGPVMRAERLAW
jgi:dihydroorotate dehydrogenase electron transfer subunit